jgi:hypothetical protein
MANTATTTMPTTAAAPTDAALRALYARAQRRHRRYFYARAVR